ncbi:choline ABC transporter substrate-binding protein [Pseudomonas sp. S75]|uniref:choline ABC transporter substrate-binding protein n=1 Tax=unclassified Pseudomonas TaxID=196821 RepID=UPI001903ABF7|nr:MULTISPECIES: choline ABC transporter substrate-binding protein [unclassified Pseudomonas]MBJ9977060.1 choline ABC transporter substrate-binding protein [Pseudomonas sp. S30]MBK0153944.1 choline ABC transporter substrate-binding protein [Pseudomonas sp. S75]
MNASPKLLLAAVLAAPLLAQAAEPEQCQTVRFSDVGWTDIAVTTATTSVVLEALGYKARTTMISVPVTYKSLATGKDLDVFLGNWMPTMENDIKAYRDAGTVETVRANLENAKYTLAVSQSLYDKGLKDFKDIVRFKQELDGKLYGIEPGNDGNRTIQKMIDENAFGLKDAGFKMVQSSEAGMLSQVDKDQRKGQGIVFLGWEPHPMNTRFKMQYLTGGDAYFGPDFGKATVYTNTRKGYTEQCSNVGQLLKNLSFELKDESTMMGYVLDDKMKPDAAARRWLKDNPGKLDAWLAGVTTVDGKPGLEAARAKLAQ